MSGEWLAWIADVLVVLGTVLVTLAVLGVMRLPDIYMKLHAAGKAASFGIGAVAAASVASADPEIFLQALLVAAFLLLTAPVSAHAIGVAAADRREPMHGVDSFDESGRGLARVEDDDPRPREEDGVDGG